jgi:hypothetical protein
MINSIYNICPFPIAGIHANNRTQLITIVIQYMEYIPVVQNSQNPYSYPMEK